MKFSMSAASFCAYYCIEWLLRWPLTIITGETNSIYFLRQVLIKII